LVVRPERIRLVDAAAFDDGREWIRIPARLIDAEYLGHSVLVEARFDGGRLRALVPADPGELRRRQGEDLFFAFEPRAVWVVPPAPAPGAGHGGARGLGTVREAYGNDLAACGAGRQWRGREGCNGQMWRRGGRALPSPVPSLTVCGMLWRGGNGACWGGSGMPGRRSSCRSCNGTASGTSFLRSGPRPSGASRERSAFLGGSSSPRTPALRRRPFGRRARSSAWIPRRSRWWALWMCSSPPGG